jgi:hypothetical protein
MISFYLLTSYLRNKKADNSDLVNELAEFASEFLRNLNMFSIYDDKPPRGMTRELFNTYKKYKQEAKILTTGESISKRLEIILGEFQRLHPFLIKDRKRLHNREQKRILYFRQQGTCSFCGKKMRFEVSSSHHGIAHSKGGRTDDMQHSKLLHEKCHRRLEKSKKKTKRKTKGK